MYKRHSPKLNVCVARGGKMQWCVEGILSQLGGFAQQFESKMELFQERAATRVAKHVITSLEDVKVWSGVWLGWIGYGFLVSRFSSANSACW